MYSDDPCSKPLLRGYVGYSVNASSVYLDYAAENIPYGTLLEDRPNHWRPEPNLVMATLRVGVCQNHDAFYLYWRFNGMVILPFLNYKTHHGFAPVTFS